MSKVVRFLGIFLVSGLAGSSKSSILQLIFEYLVDIPLRPQDARFVWRDTSALLERSKQCRTSRAGKQLLEMQPDQDGGAVLDAGPVIASIEENIAWLRNDYPSMEVLGIAGSTRAITESEYWKAKKNVRQMLVEATDEQVAKSIAHRAKIAAKMGKEIRADDSNERALKRKLFDYHEKILPGINVFPEHLVGRTHRSKPLLVRITETVQHMYCEDPTLTVISKEVFDDWMEKLNNPSHPIHVAIHAVENGQPLPPAHAISAYAAVFGQNPVLA